MSTSVNLPRPLSHAYVITGGSAAGRLDFAYQMAAAYLCEEENGPCGRCRHCTKAASHIHPDVSVISPLPDKREISVDQARALRADIYIRPNEAPRKVYLIDPADALNTNAQNALLKALEDGPDYAAFLLVCARPGHLLDTIRSRCETVLLPPEEEAADPLLEEKAATLAHLLLEGSDPDLCVFLSALERDKIKLAELHALLSLTEGALRPALRTRPRETAALLRLLRRCEDACAFNVGAGHLLGLLNAQRGNI